MSPRKPFLGCLTVLIALTISPDSHKLYSQEGQLIQAFVGSWEGEGTLFQNQAEFKMKWEWALGNKFIKLTFQNKMKTASMERVLNAEAFYRLAVDGPSHGTWFDSRGMILPLHAKTEDSTMSTLWGSPETEQGRTEYRLISEDRIVVKDFVVRGEEWKQFGEAIYQRLADHE